jgi:hypothetical protein
VGYDERYCGRCNLWCFLEIVISRMDIFCAQMRLFCINYLQCCLVEFDFCNFKFNLMGRGTLHVGKLVRSTAVVVSLSFMANHTFSLTAL